jgi:N-acetylmuramoyl-L-alanine amidase
MDTPVMLLNRFLLALCVWREARGETPKGRRLVAQTILNRTRDKRWPNTVTGVVLQPWQFSSFNKTDPNATLFPSATDVSWPDCVAAADDAFMVSPPITTANHYHVIGLDPAWRDATKVVATEGHHVFYAL